MVAGAKHCGAITQAMYHWTMTASIQTKSRLGKVYVLPAYMTLNFVRIPLKSNGRLKDIQTAPSNCAALLSTGRRSRKRPHNSFANFGTSWEMSTLWTQLFSMAERLEESLSRGVLGHALVSHLVGQRRQGCASLSEPFPWLPFHPSSCAQENFFSMEPLRVIASITGILAAAAKITTAVTGFIEEEKNAPYSAHSVLTEISDLTLCIGRLAPFIRGSNDIDINRKNAISVEQVVVISTSLVMSISELERLLHSFNLDQQMSKMTKILWVRNEHKVDRISTA